MNDIIRAFLEGASELDVVDMCCKDEEDGYLDDEIEQEYVSCIKINGVPILPPVMTPALRMECQEWRRKALEVQQRIQLQKLEKCSQMDSCETRKNSDELDPEDPIKLSENESEEVEEVFNEQQKLAVDITPRTFKEMKLEMARNKAASDLQINGELIISHCEELEGAEEFVSEKQENLMSRNVITDPSSEDIKSEVKHNELDSDIERHLKVNKNVITPRTFEEIKLEMIKERERKRCQYTPDLWTDDEASVESSVSSDISSSTNSSNADPESESTRPVSSLSLNLESLSSRIESELESSNSRRVYSSLKYCDESLNNNLLNNGQYDSLLSINTVIENPSYSVASNSFKQVLDEDNLNEDIITFADKENNISESAPRQRRGSYTLEKPSPVLLAHWQRMGSQGDVSKRSDVSRDRATATKCDSRVSNQGDFHKEPKFIKRSFPDLSHKYSNTSQLDETAPPNNDLNTGNITSRHVEHVEATRKDLPPPNDNENLSSLTDINVKKQMMTIDKSDLLHHYLESLTSPVSQPKIPPRSSSSIEKLANNFTETVIVDDDVSTSVVDSSVSDDDTVSFVDSEISISMDYSKSSLGLDRQPRKSDVIKSAELTDNSRNVNQQSLENVISHLAIQQQTSFKVLLEKQEEQRKQLREQFEQQQKEMVSQIVDQFPGILLKGDGLIQNGRNSPNHMLSNSIFERPSKASLNSPNYIEKNKSLPIIPPNQVHSERSKTLSVNTPKPTFSSINHSTSSTKTAQSPALDKLNNSRSNRTTHSGDKPQQKQGNASQSSTVDRPNSSFGSITSDPSSWRINESVQSLKITGVAVKPKKEPIKIPPEALSPSLNPAWTRLTAIARGFLTRRLMETEKVQNIVATIKDTLTCAVVLHNDAKGLPTRQDLALHARLLAQLEASCSQLHQVFFELDTAEKMAILAQNRELKKKRKSGKIAKRLSAATEARIKQRIENDVMPNRRERRSVGKRRLLKKYSSSYNKVSVKRSSTFVIKPSSNKSAAVSPRPSRRFTPSPTPSRLSKMASKRSLSSPTLVSSKLSARRSASSPTIKINSTKLFSKRFSPTKYNQKPWK